MPHDHDRSPSRGRPTAHGAHVDVRDQANGISVYAYVKNFDHWRKLGPGPRFERLADLYKRLETMIDETDQ